MRTEGETPTKDDNRADKTYLQLIALPVAGSVIMRRTQGGGVTGLRSCDGYSLAGLSVEEKDKNGCPPCRRSHTCEPELAVAQRLV